MTKPCSDEGARALVGQYAWTHRCDADATGRYVSAPRPGHWQSLVTGHHTLFALTTGLGVL
ncbi:hypothetical protein TREES_T100016088 [Tupaia chinensis]|uniref:Uncharacterized protein n=1 Tax=Tupaia chinensis TaxID=246437 RepID=L9KL55_TUPCH|nr:hypothetical protein TREES_T100016088 [Tupaia chinensis]